MSWFEFWLLLHVLTVVVAFGPTFAFPLIVTGGRKQPQHSGFATHILHQVETELTIPLALSLPFTGAGLIVTARVEFWQSEWLPIAIVLYAVDLGFAVAVQVPNAAKMKRLLEDMPATGGATGPAAAAAPPPKGRRSARSFRWAGCFSRPPSSSSSC